MNVNIDDVKRWDNGQTTMTCGVAGTLPALTSFSLSSVYRHACTSAPSRSQETRQWVNQMVSGYMHTNKLMIQ